MPAHITRPAVALPPHRITNQTLKDDVTANHNPHLPGAWPIERLHALIDNTSVEARYWCRPFNEVVAPTGIAVRTERAFADALDLMETAARQALDEAGVDPGQVGCIITSHTTSDAVPGPDVELVQRLGLAPTVARRPISTLACAGGAQALIYARDYLAAHPDDIVLGIVGEDLSTIYHQHELEPEHVGYKALFGNSGAAFIATTDRLGPGLRIDDTFEFTLQEPTAPGELVGHRRYWRSTAADGHHFDSTRKAPTAARDSLAHVQDWVGSRQHDWAVIHPGSPRIIADVATSLGLDAEKAGRHSYDSLREVGNLGGAAVLDVLRRTHNDPPVPGTSGVLVAFGPGFVVAAARGTWT